MDRSPIQTTHSLIELGQIKRQCDSHARFELTEKVPGSAPKKGDRPLLAAEIMISLATDIQQFTNSGVRPANSDSRTLRAIAQISRASVSFIGSVGICCSQDRKSNLYGEIIQYRLHSLQHLDLRAEQTPFCTKSKVE